MIFILLIFMLVLFVIIMLVALERIINCEKEHMVNLNSITSEIKWSKDQKCEYAMTQIYLDVLKNYEIKETSNNDWIIYFPCTYNQMDDEINKVNPNNPNQRIFIVNNANSLASKSDLWLNIVQKYGRNKASLMSPLTYVLYKNDELELFKTEYDPNKLYILKKNIQRQEGLKITTDKDEILNASKDNYVVAQELLQDPYLIKDRKTNMRFYVLLVCQNNEISMFIHENGFIYYTKMPFQKGSPKVWSNITTGYIERWIYHVNPLSHTEFKQYLDDKNRYLTSSEQELLNENKQISDIVFSRIYDLIKDIILALDKNICYESKLKQYVSFQLFGADIALNDKLEPKIMEFNIGPNLATYDAKDKKIKNKVVEDIFKTIKIIPDVNNGFIKII